MKSLENFKVGDIVIIVGSTRSNKGIKKSHRTLARVVEIGKHDLFLEKSDSVYSYSTTPFRAPKLRCIKIDDAQTNIEAEIAKPAPGNLVLSLVHSLGKKEKKIGILYEIHTIPGRGKIANIMVGDKFESVPYKSLIIVEK